MENARMERVRTYLNRARHELDFAMQNPDMSCDACGPYGHTFHACRYAAEKAIRAFLCFHDHEPVETHDLRQFAESHDLQRLITLAASDLSSFDTCTAAAIALMRCNTVSREPSRSELDEALRSAEQIVAFVESVLPEDVLR